ncbi:UvrD-helicase domain-containing protein, partial [bacterium]|nr:UvrD-helicase domain-containing protein [bacterium]
NQGHDPKIRQILEISMELLDELDGGFKVSTLKSVISDLISNESIVWQAGLEGEPIYPLPDITTGFDNEQDAISSIQGELNTLVNRTGKPETYSAILSETTLAGLCNHRLISKKFEVSKGVIKGKKRDELAGEIQTIEEVIQAECNRKATDDLKLSAKAFLSVFNSWLHVKNNLKHGKATLEFSDITKGAFTILNDITAQGAAWLIQQQISHLLLDEFQDTSLLQWDIFHKLSNELISTSDENFGFPNTVFIVGDVKQSIYGFRQADPTVMMHASKFLLEKGHHEVPMNKSFRTSNLILEYVTKVFTNLLGKDFPVHSTAAFGGKPFIPDHSKLIVFDTFEETEDGDKKTKAVENEANSLSDFIKSVLECPEDYPVYKDGTFRPIKASDIAILYKNKTKSEAFENALRLRGIASIKEEQNGYFQRPEIEDLTNLIKFITYPSDKLSLTSLLKSPIFNVNDAQVLEYLSSLELSKNKHDPLSHAKDFLGETNKDIAVFHDYVCSKKFNSTKEYVFDLLRSLDISSKYQSLYSGKEGNLAENNIYKFILILTELENEGCRTEFQILSRLKQLKKADLEGNAPSNDDAVKMMTIHKSKGLEFAMVLVVETAQNWFKKNTYWESVKTDSEDTKMCFLGYSATKSTPSTTMNEIVDQVERKQYEEAKRVLYVAMTRASQYLVVSGNAKDAEKNREKEKNLSFFDLLLEKAKEMGATISDKGYFEISRTTKQIALTNQSVTEIEKEHKFTSSSISGIELEIVSPHSVKDDSADVDGDVERETSKVKQLQPPPLEFAADLGIFFHKILELSVFDKQTLSMSEIELLQNEIFSATDQNDLSSWIELYTKQAVNIFNKVLMPEIDASLNVYPEAKLVHLNGDYLTKGICDLMIEYEDRVLVIDHKTTGPQDASLTKEFCLSKGYHKQLEVYNSAASAIFPEKKVQSAVILSRIEKLVVL